MKVRTFLFPIVLLFFLMSVGCGPQTVPLQISPEAPAAVGEARVSTDDNNNSRVELRLNHLAPVEKLSPPKEFYVVWAESPEGKTMNLGQLLVRRDRTGHFIGVTPLRVFRVLVTAENDLLPAAPSPQVVLRTEVLTTQARR